MSGLAAKLEQTILAVERSVRLASDRKAAKRAAKKPRWSGFSKPPKK